MFLTLFIALIYTYVSRETFVVIVNLEHKIMFHVKHYRPTYCNFSVKHFEESRYFERETFFLEILIDNQSKK